ncbi:MAG: hypothetical protein ACKVWV_02235 [Planctomycetota bacterium]
MHWTNAKHPGRRVRLGYCLNVHPADTFERALEGLRTITLPLRDRLVERGTLFGVGVYFPARVAAELAHASGAKKLDELAALVADERLDPFTYNAFPAGGFHADGLKDGVFRPAWTEPARLAFTLDVAHIALRLADAAAIDGGHVSISTHTGGFGRALAMPAQVASEASPDLELCQRNFLRAVAAFAALEERSGRRIVLSLEAEPRSNCNETAELGRFRMGVESRATDELRSSSAPRVESAIALFDRALPRHFGACFDTCHAAVEFESPAAVYMCGDGNPLGKMQFSSALALREPALHPAERARFLSLAEPRYLHQVTGVGKDLVVRADDVPELARDLEVGGERAARWLACDEWRCHFHVPVNRLDVEVEGRTDGALTTTRAYADRALELALEQPDAWGVEELHVEIETYTWDVLPGWVRSERALVDGLEREYRHVIGVLERAGWTLA